MESQNKRILKALQSGEKITPMYALREFGTFRLSARIWELREQGHKVEMKLIKTRNDKMVAQYFLPKPEKESQQIELFDETH